MYLGRVKNTLGGEYTWCVQGAQERVGRTTEPERAERAGRSGDLELFQVRWE